MSKGMTFPIKDKKTFEKIVKDLTYKISVNEMRETNQGNNEIIAFDISVVQSEASTFVICSELKEIGKTSCSVNLTDDL